MSAKALSKKSKKSVGSASKTLQSIQVKLAAPQLRKLSFVRVGPKPPPGTKIDLTYGLGVRRFAQNQIGVELSLESAGPQVEFEVIYRGMFTLEAGENRAATDWVKELKVVAKEIAPSVLFPFIRETIMGAALKSATGALVPPLVNFRELFSSMEVEIPPVPDESSHSDPDADFGSNDSGPSKE